jgi:RimJ/RimL family protein N-acetyltransferase
VITLRRATLDDADFLFALRTDPVTARNSLQPPPNKARHRRWLEERLSDTATKLYIVEVDGQPIASGRLDCRAKGVWLNLTVAPWHRGQGHAEKIIEALVAEAKTINAPEVRAIVQADNVASHKAFLGAGFTSAYLVEYVRPL